MKTVAELAEACGGIAHGDTEREIYGANSLESAGPGDLSFVANVKAAAAARRSQAGCLIADEAFTDVGNWSLIRVQQPRAAFARALSLLYPPQKWSAFVHPTAIIAASAQIAPDCYIGAYTVIGEGTRIQSGCYLAEGVHVGRHVSLGERCVLHPSVTIYDKVEIGARVILHAGCVLGSDGFGFTPTSDGYEKFPQVGAVSVEDDVEIGANSCVDRASLGVTRIGAGTKLDNLVHIAHSCTIGKHVVIAAQTGLAGGVTVGDHAVLGGQVGVADKAKIAANSVVGAKSGIVSMQKIEASEPVWGIPARPIRQHLKGLANVGKIETLKEQIRSLEKRLQRLEES
ncbi:MAG TPA: UDP-3-O-(3-hydroxymyristoyl)glucosamine N-acyltransferase [Bryobacteraceae bacterium]|nr:UDP-3-O-(3-hydroxymyristoyl)glucosamine N-acyltransferase [Bryobacteraceae bacterium]